MRGSPSGRCRFAALAALVVAALAGCNVSSNVSRELGARCQDLDECDERCLEGARYPDGFCSVSCDADADCPDGASCAEIEGGVCLFGCADRADCAFLGPDWRCRGEPERGGDSEVMVCVGLP
jgi:hypothetical protein